MEGDLKHVSAQNLECPICLNIFDDPKILSCSHTFCKGCLARLLESQADSSKLPCPVCRRVTDVPEGNVSKLQTSIALKSLVEDVNNQQQICTSCKSEEKPQAVAFCQDCGKYLCVLCEKVHSQWEDFSDHQVFSMADVRERNVCIKRRRKCHKHPKEDEEYFCSDCRRYVCFRCRMIDKHEREGHAIMEASEHEDIQRKNVEELGAKATEKVAAITAYIQFMEGQRVDLREMAKKLDNSVVCAYEEAVKQLTQRRDLLRKEVKEKFNDLERDLDVMVDTNRQQITSINAVKELVDGGRKIPLEKEALTAHDTLCEDLTGILGQEGPDYEKARHPKKRGQKISFERNVGENELELGQFKEVVWRCRDVKLSRKNSTTCMVSTPDGRMAVGSQFGGIEIFTADVQLQQTVLKYIIIISFGFLSDGRYVVRSTDNILNLYTVGCEKLDVIFETLSNVEGGIGGVTVDSDDQIFLCYRKAKLIEVFNPTGGKAVREILCDGYVPAQIIAMKTRNMLVMCENKSVKLIDESGKLQNKVTKGPDFSAFPAVCLDDSIIIAWVNHDEGFVTIDRYTSELKHVTTLIIDYQMQKPETHNWYCLQEFQSGELAFCTPDRRYIFYQARKPIMQVKDN